MKEKNQAKIKMNQLSSLASSTDEGWRLSITIWEGKAERQGIQIKSSTMKETKNENSNYIVDVPRLPVDQPDQLKVALQS